VLNVPLVASISPMVSSRTLLVIPNKLELFMETGRLALVNLHLHLSHLLLSSTLPILLLIPLRNLRLSHRRLQNRLRPLIRLIIPQVSLRPVLPSQHRPQVRFIYLSSSYPDYPQCPHPLQFLLCPLNQLLPRSHNCSSWPILPLFDSVVSW